MQEQNNPSNIYMTEDYSHLLSRLKKIIHGYKGRIIENDYCKPLESSDPFAVDPLYREKILAAKECLAAAKELVNHIRVRYKELLFARNKRPLPNWITNQKSIMEALAKTRFADVYGYITQNTLTPSRAIKITDELGLKKHSIPLQSGAKKGAIVEHFYVLFTPNYIDMENELNLNKKSIQKYLERFCEIGILIKLRKTDARKNAIYAAGYHTQYIKDDKEQTRRIYFLKNTQEMREALRHFNVRG
jgi:hypothetical protein